jgi:hypothetical protein
MMLGKMMLGKMMLGKMMLGKMMVFRSTAADGRGFVGAEVVDLEFAEADAVAGIEPQLGDRLAGPGRMLPHLQPVFVVAAVRDDLEANRFGFVEFRRILGGPEQLARAARGDPHPQIQHGRIVASDVDQPPHQVRIRPRDPAEQAALAREHLGDVVGGQPAVQRIVEVEGDLVDRPRQTAHGR